MNIRMLVPVLVLLLLAGSCAPTGPVLPNPASLVCEQQGAELDIRVEGGQSVVYCLFADGSECEEWDFYYGRCARTAPGPSLPNPASVHCEDQGGTLNIRTEDAGATGYCLFDDGSECEEWAFFGGECSPASSLPGLANPASVHCEEQGGTLDIRTDDAGEVGYCLFEDGSECEEWAFYRGECSPAGATPGLPNPASVHCEEQGGMLDIRMEDAGAVGYCVFDDGTECEEWAFLRGECPPIEPPAVMANAATAFCDEQGGTVQVRAEETGNVGYCLFPDGSECQVWSFWRGDCAPTGQYQPLAGQYQPLAGAGCSELLAVMSDTIGVEAVSREAAFQDYMTGRLGTGCQMTAIGTGLDFESFPSVADALIRMLVTRGWVEDLQYRADGPTGTATALRQENSLCLLQAGWAPSPDADCLADAPIGECDLTPEQRLYTIDLFCAQSATAGP